MLPVPGMAIAGKRHAGRIERAGKRLTDLSRLSTCRGEGKRKGGEKERKRKEKLDPQHPRSSQSSPMACTSSPTPRLMSSLPRAGSTLGHRGRHQQIKPCLPQPPETDLGAQGSQGCIPPLPCFRAPQQLWAGGAGTSSCQPHRWAAWKARSFFPASRVKTELRGVQWLHCAQPVLAAMGPAGHPGASTGWWPQRSRRFRAATDASECPAATTMPCPAGQPTGLTHP